MVKYFSFVLLLTLCFSCNEKESIEDLNTEVLTRAKETIVQYEINVIYSYAADVSKDIKKIHAVFDQYTESFKNSIPGLVKFSKPETSHYTLKFIIVAPLSQSLLIRSVLDTYLRTCQQVIEREVYRGKMFTTINIALDNWPPEKPGEGNNDEDIDMNIPTPYVDGLCIKECLTIPQKQKLEIGINNLIYKHEIIGNLFKILIDNNLKLNFQYYRGGNKICYVHSNNTYIFSPSSTMDSYAALEEWVHVIQNLYFYKDNRPNERNIEFEAKLFCDICKGLEGELSRNLLADGLGDKIVDEAYVIEKYVERKTFDNELMAYYINLGKIWDDPAYQADSFSPRAPLLIFELLGFN